MLHTMYIIRSKNTRPQMKHSVYSSFLKREATNTLNSIDYSSFKSVRLLTRHAQCIFFVLKHEATNTLNTVYILRSKSVRPQKR